MVPIQRTHPGCEKLHQNGELFEAMGMRSMAFELVEVGGCGEVKLAHNLLR